MSRKRSPTTALLTPLGARESVAVRERMMRTLKAGARMLNRERWEKHVDEAERAMDEHRSAFTSFAAAVAAMPALAMDRTRVVRLRPTQMVVDAQLVLDLERALAEAEMLRAELEQLAVEEIEEARNWKLRRVLDQAIVNVQQRLIGSATDRDAQR